jgi:PAS domain-containing protein
VEKNLEYYAALQAGEIKSYSMEKRYIKPDGSVVWVDMTVAGLQLADAGGNGHISLMQDITARKTAEIALRESERSKSVLLSNLPGMAYRCRYDRDWTMEFVSDGCRELTGYGPDTLVGNRTSPSTNSSHPNTGKNSGGSGSAPFRKNAPSARNTR